jgi:hypothetical protein
MQTEYSTLRRAENQHETRIKGLSEGAKEPEDSGGLDMILWPRRRELRLEPKIRVNPRILELQTAKEILGEIFHARPGEVEEMIQNRLEERS